MMDAQSELVALRRKRKELGSIIGELADIQAWFADNSNDLQADVCTCEDDLSTALGCIEDVCFDIDCELSELEGSVDEKEGA